ncbi:MAG: HAMP domain-containing histidine kinase [Bacteroidales bacterium]|nr:HAMP domain-containing histidine kinase [Bacteroidales bacterium]
MGKKNINNKKEDIQFADEINLLKEKIIKLNSTIETLNEKLENSEKFKSHFISNITNELINPFTSIIGLSRIILSSKKEEWKNLIRMVALIHSEAFHLEFQLKNLFTAAKIEAGIESQQPVKLDVKNFMKSIEDIFYDEARRCKMKMKYKYINKSSNQYFLTDPEKIKIILSNIIHNAIKFSNNQSEVKIVCEHTNQFLSFKISDKGIGIPKEKFKVIFDRFERLNTNINSISYGQGLGLSVSVSLLDIIGGSITLKSKINKGSDFTFKVPQINYNTDDIAITDGEFYFNDGKTF